MAALEFENRYSVFDRLLHRIAFSTQRVQIDLAEFEDRMFSAELVEVAYDPLPPVIDPEIALRDDVVLFPDHGTNVIVEMATKSEADFSDCEVVVEERIVNQRLTAAPIRPGPAGQPHHCQSSARPPMGGGLGGRRGRPPGVRRGLAMLWVARGHAHSCVRTRTQLGKHCAGGGRQPL